MENRYGSTDSSGEPKFSLVHRKGYSYLAISNNDSSLWLLFPGLLLVNLNCKNLFGKRSPMVKHLSLHTQISFWFQSFKNQTALCHSYILRVPTLVRTLTDFTPPLEVCLGGGGGGGLLGNFTMPPSTHLKISNCCMSLKGGCCLPFSS